MLDLGPAATEMSRLVREVRDDQLDAPTPCPGYSLGALLDHVHGLALAFRMAADKERFEDGSTPAPKGDADALPADWREAIGTRLDALAHAWTAPAAWEGTTWIAGFEAPAENVAMTAVNELVVHGWDVARASHQTIAVDSTSLGPCTAFAEILTGPDGEQLRGEVFGPPVPVPDDVGVLDRIVAANGRDPAWSAG